MFPSGRSLVVVSVGYEWKSFGTIDNNTLSHWFFFFSVSRFSCWCRFAFPFVVFLFNRIFMFRQNNVFDWNDKYLKIRNESKIKRNRIRNLLVKWKSSSHSRCAFDHLKAFMWDTVTKCFGFVYWKSAQNVDCECDAFVSAKAFNAFDIWHLPHNSH